MLKTLWGVPLRKIAGDSSLCVALGGVIALSTVNPFAPAVQEASDTVHLNGAGSTFAQPFYALWIDAHEKTHPNVKLNYQGIGSGAGIKQVQAGIVEWGGTDAPMRVGTSSPACSRRPPRRPG